MRLFPEAEGRQVGLSSLSDGTGHRAMCWNLSQRLLDVINSSCFYLTLAYLVS